VNKVEIFQECHNILGEGVTWSESTNTLFWLDIPMPSRLHMCSFNNHQYITYDMPEMITAMAERSDNNLLIASHYGLNNFNLIENKFEQILKLETDKPQNRCNDGAADFLGNFWIGTMQNNIAPDGSAIDITQNSGSLYCIDKDFKIKNHESNIGISNTFAWSPDNNKFYFCDTLTGLINSYDYDFINKKILNKKQFAKFDRGYPDGSTVDSEGFLWNCRWGGSCVVRFDPNGNVDRVIDLPVPNVTSCTFGGNDLKTLFITTARYGMSNEELQKAPHSGNLFAIQTDIQGKPDFKFAN